MRHWVLLLLLFLPVLACAQGTFTAGSCNQIDVNACINNAAGSCSPSRHTAVNGDTINIPAGSCTWSAGITVPSGIGISIIGAGTPNTGGGTQGAGTVTTNLTGGAITMHPTFGNSTSRISSIKFIPGTSAPVNVSGTCAAGGCPNVRLDNLIFPSSWSTVGLSDAAVCVISNMFGVADHNTVGDVAPSTSYVDFINVGHGSWQGLGFWGDQSWTSADTFGTTQALYLENNIFNFSAATDTDISSSDGGGARIACRFNTFNSINFIGGCTGHGTDTTGRPRGVRQWEGYWNTGNCTNTSSGCGSLWPGRSGVGMSFSNTFTNASGGFLKALNGMDAQRRWRPDTYGSCDGSAAFDTNDGVTYYSGTIGSIVTGGDFYTINDSGLTGWTTSPRISVGSPYSVHNVTQGFGGEIVANNSTTSINYHVPCESCVGTPAATNSYQILRATVCMDQPNRSGGALLTGDATHPVLQSTGLPGPVSQTLDPSYEGNDSLPATANNTIASNNFTALQGRDYFAEAANQPAQTSDTSPFNGAMTQQQITSWTCNGGTGSCTVTVGSTAAFSSTGYVSVGGTASGTTNPGHNADAFTAITGLTGTTITYTIPGVFGNSGAPAQGIASPQGAGHGTLARRPTTCTTGVGYWATDQGTWNTFNSSQEGQLYTCTSPNTWSLTYTPLTYPHPLISGGGGGNPIGSLNPTSLTFGNQGVGTTSTSQSFTFTNTGGSALTISTITITGDFAQTNNCPFSPPLAAGAFCTFNVTFTPTAIGTRLGNVTITSNATNTPSVESLTGTGIPPTLSGTKIINGVQIINGSVITQ